MKKMTVRFPSVWSKRIFLLCLFILAVQLQKTEADQNGNATHKREAQECDDDFKAACSSACNDSGNKKCDDSFGIPSCECPENNKFSQFFGCAADKAEKPKSSDSEDSTDATCAFKCSELTKASKVMTYTATFCKRVIANAYDKEEEEYYPLPYPNVCTCAPSSKSAMEETTSNADDMRGIILGLVQAFSSFISAVVKTVKDLMKTLLSSNFTGSLSDLVDSLKGIVKGLKRD